MFSSVFFKVLSLKFEFWVPCGFGVCCLAFMGYLCGFVVGVLSIYIWRAVTAVYIYYLLLSLILE